MPYGELDALLAHDRLFFVFEFPGRILIKIREPAVCLKLCMDAGDNCLIAKLYKRIVE